MHNIIHGKCRDYFNHCIRFFITDIITQFRRQLILLLLLLLLLLTLISL